MNATRLLVFLFQPLNMHNTAADSVFFVCVNSFELVQASALSGNTHRMLTSCFVCVLYVVSGFTCCQRTPLPLFFSLSFYCLMSCTLIGTPMARELLHELDTWQCSGVGSAALCFVTIMVIDYVLCHRCNIPLWYMTPGAMGFDKTKLLRTGSVRKCLGIHCTESSLRYDTQR